MSVRDYLHSNVVNKNDRWLKQKSLERDKRTFLEKEAALSMGNKSDKSYSDDLSTSCLTLAQCYKTFASIT